MSGQARCGAPSGGSANIVDAPLRGSLAEVAPGDTIETLTILATATNAVAAPIHHRMTVLVTPERFDL